MVSKVLPTQLLNLVPYTVPSLKLVAQAQLIFKLPAKGNFENYSRMSE
jgi:hypothetical protein